MCNTFSYIFACPCCIISLIIVDGGLCNRCSQLVLVLMTDGAVYRRALPAFINEAVKHYECSTPNLNIIHVALDVFL